MTPHEKARNAIARILLRTAPAAVTCLALAAGAVDMPQVISHRGESQDRPENTMAAFRLAFERGVDGVECDVYTTTDGVPVIIHDSTTGRTAGSGTNLTVTASSWNDLRDVRVGAFGKWIGTGWEGETLPKLEEFLALLSVNDATRCVVELKGNGANGLVASVAAAVQAQPLATKERVVFIAFDANLVRAVRTALPGYDAWLLLGGGTYTGADLVSRIQACDATGVDILHTATFSAEDVAAVKAAGFAFAVWTPNSDATAFALAEKGVDAITTDRGGAMKTALAALVDSWREIRDSSLPDGATRLDAHAGANVVVESNVGGAEGVEANGPYLVNGHHSFSAAATTADGNEWEPTGYKLEAWTAEKGTWDLVGEYDGASFAYTNCAARSRVRLTWNWRLKNGVKKLDADSYVQAGLLLDYDGIRNAGHGLPHDPAATTWKNLCPGPDATRETVVADRPGAWTSDGYDFAAGDCFVTDAAVALTNQVTVQIVADYDATGQTNNWPSPFGASQNGDVFGLYTYTPYTGSANDRRGDRLMFRSDPVNGASRGLQPWNGRIANAIVDYNRVSFTGDAALSWWNGAFKAPPASYRYCIGTAWSSASERKKRMFKGRLHAIRIYDRMLTVTELRRNKEIDYVRFYGTAGLSSDTDLVEVRSDVPGIALEDTGGWLVRGTGSKTFTAPASVTVGNCSYACAGYRLETWNAAKRMWENPIEAPPAPMAELCSASMSGTTDRPSRRITWLWTLTAGVRAAADYGVGDYVQQGLVAHYDGIRNSGARNAHSTRSIFWRDLSCRANDMIAVSNTSFAAWIGKGHRFTAAEECFFQMQEGIALGMECTVQAAMDVTFAEQTTDFPLYFGFGSADRCIFTRAKGATLEVKTDGWVSGQSTRVKLGNWGGKYLTHVITPVDHHLFQGTERAGGVGRARENFLEIPVGKMAIGAPNTYSGESLSKRCMTGDYYSLRVYSRALTDAEIAQNRKVDDIRYRDAFASYRDLVVVNEQPAEGANAASSAADGEYELTGEWTFTAAPVVVAGEKLFPKYTLETLVNGEWVETGSASGGKCSIAKGVAPIRLTWRWERQDGTVIGFY
ncbi:MAG: hypothetical protein IJ658_05570 [Kiritimatiellae bacterium]|nr:hypothetical protein [Kiritimatiellia bacterium]